MTSVDGVVERLVYRNDEAGFVVARLRLHRSTSRHARIITISGTLPGLAVGEPVTLGGHWTNHRRYGATFEVETFHPHAPTDAEGVRRYLGSGLLRGVGPATADRMVDVFGERTLEVLEQTPELLASVKGISAKKASDIGAAWAEQRETRALALFLQAHEVSPTLAPRIQAQYGAEALAIIQHNPYRLERDVAGIGFKTADTIAHKLGLPENSPERTEAAIRYLLSRATDDGHCFLPHGELVDQTARLLTVPTTQVGEALAALRRDRQAIVEEEAVYLPALYVTETGFARRLQLLTRTAAPVAADEADRAILATAAAETGVLLSEEQREAVALALRHPVTVLTGGPGTGKTTALRALIAILERRGIRYCLAAPTGRAARRLAEATERPAMTLHRLLEYAPASSDFRYSAERPLPYQFVIVDETSMVDVVLAYHLGQALAPNTQLLLVGDVDQLPSVGPGNVLRDLIASDLPAVARLTALFRQAAGSHIVRSAHRIKLGELPDLRTRGDDFYFIEERQAERAVQLIVRLLKERIPARFGLDPVADVQVLCPVNRGPAGIIALNKDLQEALNGARLARSISWGGQQFAPGDKVMQIRNNYDLNVFNGDVGQVVAVDAENQTLHVDFGSANNSAITAYGLRDLDELQLAYAASVHKAQGSEYPCVVLLLLPQHGLLLRRDLLYTAVTRARRLCVIVGSKDALARAVATSDPEARNTRLRARLQAWPAIADRTAELPGLGFP